MLQDGNYFKKAIMKAKFNIGDVVFFERGKTNNHGTIRNIWDFEPNSNTIYEINWYYAPAKEILTVCLKEFQLFDNEDELIKQL